jgi:1-acyl-sn-glycerol-3-phosphate acyltransferase
VVGDPVEGSTSAPVAEPSSEPSRRRARPLPARIRPSEVAARRGDTREGLAWLGHPPQVRATLLVRLMAAFGRSLAFGVFRFHARIEGREHIPDRGGYIVMAAAHRGWMDPLLVVHALPLTPRVWFLGGGAAAFSSRWKEVLLRRLGGILPVWRGGVGIDNHVVAARAVLEQGGVFAQMPEGTVSGPPGRVGTFRVGASLIVLRTRSRVLPIAIAGTEELYVGKRMAVRILEPVTIAELLGPGWDGVLPELGTRAELDLARRISDAVQARLTPVVETLQPWTVDPPDHPRRLRERLTWLLLARGPLDRTEAPAPRPTASPDDPVPPAGS